MSAFVRLTPNFGATLSPFGLNALYRPSRACGPCRAVAREQRAGEKSSEVTLTESTTRTGFEIALETYGGFFAFEGKIYLKFPRPEFRCVTRYVGLMFLDSFAQVLAVADVTMSWHRE
jgi:hypothetical protein